MPVSNTHSAPRRWRANVALATVCVVAVALAVSACSGSSAGGSSVAHNSIHSSTGSAAAGSTGSAPATSDDTNGYPPGAAAKRPPKRPRYVLGPVGVVRRAYRHTPGVELTTATAPSAIAASPRFVLLLRRDAVVGEEFVDPRPDGGILVTRHGFPTFMRAANRSCWQRLAPSDPRNLVNVPGPFPENGKVRVLPPTRQAWHAWLETRSAFWFLPSQVKASPIVNNKSFLFLTINPHTHQIESIRVNKPDHAAHAHLQVKTLPVSPTLPTPTPSCTPA